MIGAIGPDRGNCYWAAPAPKFQRLPEGDSELFMYHRTDATFVLLSPENHADL